MGLISQEGKECLPGLPIKVDDSRALVILGSGLNDDEILDAHLKPDWRNYEFTFKQFGITVPHKEGHPGKFVLSKWDGVNAVVSRGRVHLYQREPRMLRKWYAVALALMGRCRRVIVTQAVGGLKENMTVGSIALPTQFIADSFDGSGYLDGWTDNGHPASEAVLPQENSPFNVQARSHAERVRIRVSSHTARYKAVTGPRFGGQGERAVFGCVFGCDSIGMSVIPELDFTTIENMTSAPDDPIHLGAIQVVSDNQDHPSDKGVVEEMRRAAPKVTDLIGALLNDASW